MREDRSQASQSDSRRRQPAPLLRAVAYAFAYGDIPCAHALLTGALTLSPATRAALLAACAWRAGHWVEGVHALRFAHERGEESPWVREALAQAWTLAGAPERAPARGTGQAMRGLEPLPLLPARQLSGEEKNAIRAALQGPLQTPAGLGGQHSDTASHFAGYDLDLLPHREGAPSWLEASEHRQSLSATPTQSPPSWIEEGERLIAARDASVPERPSWLEAANLIQGAAPQLSSPPSQVRTSAEQRSAPTPPKAHAAAPVKAQSPLSALLLAEEEALRAHISPAELWIAVQLPAPTLRRPGQGARSVRGQFLFALSTDGLLLSSLEGGSPWRLKVNAITRWQIDEFELCISLFDEREILFNLEPLHARTPALFELFSRRLGERLPSRGSAKG